ncbi:VTT domain-containing protein [Flavobacteriaceae bacterium S0862]|nr:VTT domain-containing protein [Flavobacteriaceae bacterium S0862]
MSPKTQKLLKWLWISLIAICITVYIIDPAVFKNDTIAAFISKFNGYAWSIYFLIHLLRGFVLLPSTPLIFAGVILFPDQLIWVLLVSLIGILGSSLLIYYCSDKLGFSSFFESESKNIKLIKEKLSGKYGFYYILFWSFFPIVPTDIICYVSGALRIKLPVFVSALLLGELVLCSVYIFGASYFIN